MQDASYECEPEVDGRGGHALHPLHVRHDRQTQGHRAHHRRLSHRRLRDHEVGLRSQGRRRLLVHGRHRLGHRPQLRRLRPARQRRDRGDVRRRAGLAEEGSPLGDRRALRRHDLLHRADRDSRVHEVGHRVAREAQPVVAAADGIGRRADQSRSVDLVSPAHRQQPLSDRRHVVADRNRRDHDHAAAGHHAHQARIGDAGVSRHQRRDPQRQGRRAFRSAAACSRSPSRGRRCCAPSTAITIAT